MTPGGGESHYSGVSQSSLERGREEKEAKECVVSARNKVGRKLRSPVRKWRDEEGEGTSYDRGSEGGEKVELKKEGKLLTRVF